MTAKHHASHDRKGLPHPERDPDPVHGSSRRLGRPSLLEADALSKRIVDVALDEFRERGFAGASIERIAVAAGVTRSAIYRRYADKQALFSGVADEQIGRLQELANQITSSAQDPLTVLAATLRSYVHFLLSPMALDLQRIIIAEAASFPSLAQRLASPLPTDIAIRIDGLVSAAVASGQLRNAPSGLWRDILLRMVADGPRWQAIVNPVPWTKVAIDRDFDRMWPLFLAVASCVDDNDAAIARSLPPKDERAR